MTWYVVIRGRWRAADQSSDAWRLRQGTLQCGRWPTTLCPSCLPCPARAGCLQSRRATKRSSAQWSRICMADGASRALSITGIGYVKPVESANQLAFCRWSQVRRLRSAQPGPLPCPEHPFKQPLLHNRCKYLSPCVAPPIQLTPPQGTCSTKRRVENLKCWRSRSLGMAR